MWGMVMWADISPTAPAGRVAALCGGTEIPWENSTLTLST